MSVPINSPFTGSKASGGIAQLTPGEISSYVPGCDIDCLFQPDKAIEGMAAKIASADALLPGDINPTDRLMVLALAQNNGPGAAELYLNSNEKWAGVYGDRPGDWDQLGIVLENIRYLISTGDFILPEGVDLERWERIFFTNGQSES